MPTFSKLSKDSRTTTVATLVVVFALTVSFVSGAFAAGETGTVAWNSGVNPGLNIRGTSHGTTSNEWAGTIYLDVTGGSRANTFCTDINHGIGNGDKVTASDEVMDCRMRWLLLHYPPRRDLTEYQSDNAPDRLADVKQEMAARQAAVWYFSDGFIITDTQTTPLVVYTRTLEIIAAVNAQSNPCEADAPNVAIMPSSSTNVTGAAALFTVKLTQGTLPLAGKLVSLESSLGTPDPLTVTTDNNGEATFALSSTIAGTSRITATAQMSLPVGTIFLGADTNKQKIVLGQQASGPVIGNATAMWVTGGTIAVHVFDDLNMDGVTQDGELGQSGWTVAIQGVGTKTTDTNGDATWSMLSGDYMVVLTQKSGWYATTPITQMVSLPSGGIIAVNFGQIKLPVVKVQVFQDHDLSASFTGGDSGLAGWMVGLFRRDGSQAAGWNASSDAQGWVYFSNDPRRNPADLAPGDYYVQETLQSGWQATTGISRSFTLVNSQVHEEYLGNFQAAANIAIVVTAGDTLDGGIRQIHGGDSVTFDYRVTNTGNTYLSNVQVIDDQYGAVCTITDFMAPGATQTCNKTVNPSASVTNVGTATGNPALSTGADIVGLGDVMASDNSIVRVLNPSIAVTVSAPVSVTVGSVISYIITVRNTGDTGLSNVGLGDSRTAFSWSGSLTTGESRSFTAAYTTLPTDVGTIVNAVSASGQDALGRNTSDASNVSTLIIMRDSDGDGVLDVDEGASDGDSDGTPNYLDTDSDGDGVTDADEGDTDGDGDGTPNFLDADSDGDGIPDWIEGVGDPDHDGLPNFLDADSDGDGIPDRIEGVGDPDHDGLPNFLDADSDGDGIPDQIEGIGDPDHDGLPNFLDADSDGDGISDRIEGIGDPDHDGTPNFLDADSDGDGILDQAEGVGDPDHDGTPSFLDADSDGDGIPDAVEAAGDSNGDGRPDLDADHDGIPNFLDMDSDGDGIPDSVEGTGDDDKDGIPNYLDPNPSSNLGRFKIYLPIVAR
jgi:hypothetical protein